MSDIEDLVAFVETIAKITEIVRVAYEAFLLSQEIGRRWWVRPANLTREEQGFFTTCTQKLKEVDEEHFFKATRMNVANFNFLLSVLKEKLQRFSNRKPIDAETRLSLTLLHLAQGCNIQVLAWAHKLGISTVRRIIYETCDAIWDELHGIYLSPPNVNEQNIVAEKFFVKTGMPNCLGAIGGKHINIVRPSNSGSLYCNYKKTYSIVLLAACDANYVFTYADVGALGSQSDGGVLARSVFGRKLLSGSLEVPMDKYLPGRETLFPYFFVGDSAFPLKRNLMRPFPGHSLPEDKDNFNNTLSKARVHIENAFGILANRWRILLSTIHASPENADKIVLATIVLHNFLMLQNDRNYFTLELIDHVQNFQDVDGRWRSEIRPLQSYRPGYTNRSSASAYILRDSLKDYLQNN